MTVTIKNIQNEPVNTGLKDSVWQAMQQTKTRKQHVIVITDKSGSMGGLAEEVRKSFNQHLADMRSAAVANPQVEYRYTVTVFDTNFRLICVDAPLADVPNFTRENYTTDGFTALLDAVGKTVMEFENRTTLGPDDRVLLVIQTDGAENSSKEYSWDQIKALLTERAARTNWKILYLGEGADSWLADGALGAGVSILRSHSGVGHTQTRYASMTRATLAYSAPDDGAVAMAANLSEHFEPDASVQQSSNTTNQQ